MTTVANGTYDTDKVEYNESLTYELVYVALTLLLGTLSALIASSVSYTHLTLPTNREV